MQHLQVHELLSQLISYLYKNLITNFGGRGRVGGNFKFYAPQGKTHRKHYNQLLSETADKAVNIWSWAKDWFPSLAAQILDGYFTSNTLQVQSGRAMFFHL